jgi:hypothetical protein
MRLLIALLLLSCGSEEPQSDPVDPSRVDPRTSVPPTLVIPPPLWGGDLDASLRALDGSSSDAASEDARRTSE